MKPFLTKQHSHLTFLKRSIFAIILLLIGANVAVAQRMTVHIVTSVMATTCTDNFLQGAPDPRWQMDVAGQGYSGCQTSGTNNFDIFNGCVPLTVQPGGNVPVCVRFFEDDAAIGCGGSARSCEVVVCQNYVVPAAGVQSPVYAITGVGASSGTITFYLTYTAIPNDNVCNAAAITTTNVQVNGNNDCATVEVGEVSAGGNVTPTNTIWYQFTAPASGHIRASTDHGTTNFDTEIALWQQNSGTACTFNTMSYVNDDDDILTLINNNSEFDQECLVPGMRYYLQVDGDAAGETGNVGTTIQDLGGPGPAPNNFICNAIDLGTVAATATVGNANLSNRANFCATNAGEPNPGWLTNGNDQGVWFKFTTNANPSAQTQIVAHSDPQGFGDAISLQLALYKVTNATPCSATPSFTEIDRAYNPLNNDEEIRADCLDPNTTYYILVDGYQDALGILGGVQGYFGIAVTDGNLQRGGDQICDALDLGTVPNNGFVQTAPLSQTNVCATDTNDPTPSRWSSEQGVWYSFIAPPSGSVRVEATSDAVICLTCDPIDLQLAIYSTSNNLCSGTANEFQSEYDPIIFDEEMKVRCLTPGQRYWLFVDGGPLSQTGIFGLQLYDDQNWPAPNDDPCNPVALGAPTVGNPVQALNQNNYCADNVLEPIPQQFGNEHSVWYTFIAPPSGTVEITATNIGALCPLPPCADAMQLQVAVFDRGTNACTPSNTFTEMPGTNDIFNLPLNSKYTVPCLTPGHTYYVLVDGQGNILSNEFAFGRFDLQISDTGQQPAGTNDLICNAIALGNPNSAPVGTVQQVGQPGHSQNNYCATHTNEPAAAGVNEDQTVWYSFIAPTTTNVSISIATDNPLCLSSGCDWMWVEAAVFASSDNTCNGVLSQMNTDAGIINIPPDWNAEVPCLIPGNTYFVMVNGGNINNQGHFDIQITAIPARPFPPNDEPCNATALGNVFAAGGATLPNETNLCADDPNDPQPSAFGTDHTVWYSFTTPNTASSFAVRVYAESTTINPLALACIDPQIAVFGSNNGTCVKSTFYEVESGYNPVDFPLFSETLDVQCLEPNKTYYIMIDGSVNVLAEGNFSLHVEQITATPIATNNLACQAINLGTLNPTGTIGSMATTYNNFCADTEANEPSSFLTGIDQTVWFTFTTPNGGANMTYDATVHVNSDPNNVGDNIDIQAAVYRGTCAGLGSMQLLKDADPLFSGNADVELHCLDANTSYYIQIDGSNFNVEGYFGITVQGTGSGPRPNNDNRCNAVALGSIPVNGTLSNGIVYTNYCATTEIGEADPSAFNIEKTVWFTFVAPASGNVTLHTFSDPTNLGDGIDLEVAIYQAPAGCSGGMVEINSNHDGAGLSQDEDMSVTCLYAGQTYYIQIDGSRDLGEDAQGYFTLTLHDDGGVSNHPYNDMICNAYSFGLATATQQIRSNETNVCATVQLGEPGLNGYADETVWYSFIAPPSGRVDIDVHAISSFLVTGMDSEVHLVSSSNGTCTGTLNEIASSYFPSSAIDEHIDGDCLVPGNTYFIQIDGAGLLIEGNFDIKLKDALPNYATAQPANNEPCNPIVLTVQATACFGGGSNATTENYGQPTVSMPAACNAGSNCGDTWYSFTMPATGIVNVRGEDDNVGGGVLGDFSNLHINAYRGVCGSLTSTGNCASGGQGIPNDPDPSFELTGTPGETIWLQVFGDGANDFGENFQICVSVRCGADNCANAVNMIPGAPYCWSTVGQGGETVGGPNSGYHECTDQSNPEHSVYFKFHSDCNGDSLTLALIGATIGGSCILGNSPTDGFNMSLYADSSPCDGNGTFVDCQSFDVCQHAVAFNWSHTYTNLAPNTEYILMIDGGVPLFGGGNDFGQIMITTRGNPQINIVTTGIVCSGGTATATAHALGGGARPFTFNWTRPNGTSISTGTDSTLTNLTAGIYSCTATDARGCTSTSTTNIVDNTTPIVATAIQDLPPLCANSLDGAATATATGGAGNYTFLWDSGSTAATATNLNAGPHTVTITDASNCTKTATVAITGPPIIVLQTTQNQPVSCNGGADGQATVTASGGTMPVGSSYTYTWDTGGNAATTTTSLNAGTHTVTVTDANNCTNIATLTITEPIMLTATVVQNTAVLCNGQANGQATATGIDGNAGYTYLWDNGVATATATNLSAGTHTVQITDSKSCSTIASVTITEPAALSATALEDHPTLCVGTCNGQATATGTGGTLPYTFNWDSGATAATATNLCVGSHQVTMTDSNGCTALTSLNTTEPLPLATAMSIDIQVLCNGACTGIATVTPSGGTAPYTFFWSDASAQTTATAANLCATTYTVTVSDAHNCTKTASVTLFSPTAIIATATPGNDAHCGQANGSATANASGGTPTYTYLWDDTETTQTATALTAGSHTVQITDANSCTKIATVTVGAAANLGATIPTINSPLCNGACNGSLISMVTPLVGGETYLWSDALAQTTANANGLCATTYTVTITDAFGCTATASATLSQPSPLSVTVSNLINVRCQHGADGSATATGTGGTGTAYTYHWDDNETAVTAVGLGVGTHLVTVTDGNNCTATASFDLTEPTELLLVATLTNDVRCAGSNDGAAAASASGGANTSYSYHWDNGVNSNINSTLTTGTHNVTATDANGCTATATVIIGTSPPLQVTIVQNQTISCHSGSDGIIEAQVAGGTSPYTFLWNDIINTAIHTLTNSSVYTVTVTDANNCTKTATFQLTEPVGITATIQVTGTSLCGQATGSATVNASGGIGTLTYTWDNGILTATNNGLTAGMHVVTITDSNGCAAQASCLIAQNSTLAATAMQTTSVTCAGADNGTALATITGGTAPYTILWDNSNSTPVAAALTGGLHTVIVTDAANCSLVAIVTIDEPNPLLAAAALLIDAHCGLDNGSAIVNVSGGTLPYTYLWDNTETAATAIGLSPISHSVTVTDAHGCTQTAIAVISAELPLVATTVVLNPASCNQANGGAECIGIHGTAPYTYVWNNGINAAINNTLSAGTHTVTATDATGCTASGTVNIPNASGLSVSVTSQTEVNCHGACNGAVTISIASSVATTLIWNLPNQTGTTVTNLCVGTYTAYISDATGCTTNISVIITEPTLVSLVANQVSPATCNNNGSATVTVTGGTPPYTYNWDSGFALTQTATGLSAGVHMVSVLDAQLCATVTTVTVMAINPLTAIVRQTTGVKCSGGSDGTANVTVTGGVPPYTYAWDRGGSTTQIGTTLNAGNHTVTVSDAAGCSKVAIVNITQPNPLTVQFNNIVNAGCNGQFLGSVTAEGVQGSTPYTYLWAHGPATASIAALIAGLYTVTVTDGNGCQANNFIVISETPPPVIDSVPIHKPICYNAQNGNATVFASSGINPLRFNWNNNVTTALNTSLNAGTYTVTVTDGGGCSTASTVHLTQPRPIQASTSIVAPLCYGESTGSISIGNVIDTIGATNYSIDGGVLGANPVFAAVAPGAHNLLLQDSRGCEWLKTVNIPSGILLSVRIELADATGTHISNNATLHIGDSLRLKAILNNFASVTYKWSLQPGLSCYTCKYPVAKPLLTTTYTVTVTDLNGCTATDEITISVEREKDIYIPNTFTPNNDGVNDLFTAFGGAAAERIVLMRIYDRWGELIYEGKDLPLNGNRSRESWNGTFKDQPCNPGVFAYYLEVRFVDGEVRHYSGDVTLTK